MGIKRLCGWTMLLRDIVEGGHLAGFPHILQRRDALRLQEREQLLRQLRSAEGRKRIKLGNRNRLILLRGYIDRNGLPIKDGRDFRLEQRLVLGIENTQA